MSILILCWSWIGHKSIVIIILANLIGEILESGIVLSYHRNKWVIRGLWPASKNLDYLNCLQFTGYDPNCYVNHPYDESELTSATKMKLNNYWPEIDLSNNIK